MDEKKFRDIFIVVLILGLIIFSFLVVKPFLVVILSSMILAYLLSPVYIRLNRLLKVPNLSAAIISISLILLIIIPFWFVLPLILRHTFDFYSSIQGVDLIAPFRKVLPMFFSSPEITRNLIASLDQAIARASSIFVSMFGNLIKNMPFIFMSIIVMVFIFFFTLRDGEKIVSYVRGLSPLKQEAEKKFLSRFRDITKSVIYGFLIIGLIQGIVTGIGLFIFKAPQPIFLTLMSIILGILPVLGTWLVWLPVGIVMIVQGHAFNGWGLLIYGVLFTTWIDPVLRSLMLKKSGGVSTSVALIGMLGGYLVFGLIGLIIGPLILSYLILIIEFYKEKKFTELFES